MAESILYLHYRNLKEAYDRIVVDKLEIFNPNVKSVLLNVTNLKIEEDLPIEYDNVLKIKQDSPNIDGIVGKESLFGQKSDIDTYVVFEPKQIHILDYKQDIEGFKGFVKDFSSPNSSLNNLDVETKERLIEKGWTQEKFNSVSQEEREQAIRCA